jgi:hypothetical protein
VKLPIISYIELASNILPIVAGAVRRRLLRPEMLVLFVYVVFSFAVELFTLYLAFNSINNLWVLHIYALIEFILMVIIFSRFEEMMPYRKFVPMYIALYSTIWIVSKIFFESFDEFDQYSSPSANILLIIIALRALYLSAQAVEPTIWRTSFFWFSVAVLLKFAGDFTLYLFGDWFIGLGLADGMAVWSLHWTINIISNIGFLFAILCQSQTPAHTGSS